MLPQMLGYVKCFKNKNNDGNNNNDNNNNKRQCLSRLLIMSY